MTCIRLETRLDCPPETAARLVMDPQTMRHVASPLAVMEPVDPPEWPARWQERVYTVRLKILGLVPAGRQRIDIRLGEQHAEAGAHAFVLHDAGGGDLMTRWDHWIFATAHEDGGTRYVDRVEVGAGWLTPLSGLMTRAFFAWRQHRLRALAAKA
ncbi:SRPBCC family protein [Marinicauda algicola]|uniref:SRPBCC family protein n=1 Tax=Marinicauda algicola TaxID=2029849 RepID=A0A4S2GZV0_9PROT|nr:SRPBCC family protein [Marinicauda algicola]TGY88461.1 SRPBCC family protein [Marinicauda algicola]